MTLSDAPHKAQDEAAGSDASSADDHYLKRELYDLVQSDPAIFEFIQSGSLDGLWYWDLTEPEIEWMSPRFWEVLGFDPETKTHQAAEWQDLIFEEDLQTAAGELRTALRRPQLIPTTRWSATGIATGTPSGCAVAALRFATRTARRFGSSGRTRI